MRRRVSLIAIIMLLGQTFLNTFGAVVSAVSINNDESIFSEINYLDEHEQPVDFDTYTGPVVATVDWSAEGKEITSETTEEIQLNETVTYEEQAGNLIGEEDTTVGTYQVTTGGKLSVQFNEAIESQPQAKNTLRITGRYEAPVPETQVAGETAAVEETEEESSSEEASGESDDEDPAQENEIEVAESNQGDAVVADDTADTSDTGESETEEIKKALITPMAITSNPVTDFTFEINEDGEWRTIGDGETVTIDPETISATQLTYNLVFDNELDVIVPGETYTLQLPDVVSPVPTTNPVVLVEEFNISYTIDSSGLVTISFPDGWETNDHRTLNLELQQSFNKEIFTENVEQEIHIPYTDSEGYTAILVGRSDLIDGSDYKEGIKTYIVDTDGNIITDNTNVQANRADWKIRVNDQLGVYDSAIVTDTLNEGHVLDAGSVKVYRVNRNKLTGEQIGERVDVTSEFTANPADGGFSIDFGAIDDTYEIEYTTIIDQVDPGSENTIIDNLAEITYDGTTKEYEDEFELEWPLGSEPIIKNGSVDPNDPSKILWTVYYNYEKDNLGEVTFVDELSHGEVDPTSLKVYEVTNPQPGNLDPWAGGATWVNPQPVASVDGTNMTFSIPESDGKAYYITFESTVRGGLIDQNVTNTIDDENPNTSPGEDTVIVTTPLGGATKDGNVVYEDGVPYILWTVTFNQNKVAYDKFSFSDSFDTSLLTVDMDSFVLDPETDFSVTPSKDGFNFTLNGTSERKIYTLTYKTTYTDDGLKVDKVTNKVDLGWDGDGVGPSEEVGHPVAGIKKEASYVTGEDSDGKARQEIEWLVAFNTNHLVLEDPVLSDRFSPAELEIVPDSFEFYTSDGEVKGSLYTYHDVLANTETDTKGYDIEFHGKTEPTTYYVKYRTTIPEKNTGASNTATLVWQGNTEKDNANVETGINEPGASKNGTVERAEDGSSKKINWEIRFNQNERVIHDLVITDTYSPTDAAIVDEIAIHKAGGTPLVQGSDGDYVISEPFGDGGFTIEFNDQTEPVEYVLTYSTEYNAYSDNVDAKNEAVVKFLGGEHSISKTITPVVLNVEKQSTGVDTSSKPAVISWAITSNTNLKTLQDAILVDTIEDDQLFVDGSMKLNGEEVTPTWNGTEFTVELPDGANSHVLTYETQIVSYPSNYGSNHDEYYNKVDLINYSNEEDSIKEAVSDDATARYYQQGENNNPSKSGEQDPETDLIVWIATVNPDAQPIKNASIRDILDTNQVYFTLEDGSIDLTVERVTGDSTEIVPSSDYTVVPSEVEGVPQFVLTFNDREINHTYKLTYRTSLRDEIVGQREVSNRIQVIGYDSQTVIEEIQNSTTSSKWYFGGSGSSQSLTMSVIKIDKDNNNIPLKGVEFELENIRDGKVISIVTDKDGSISIPELRAGRYILSEITPAGYQPINPIHFYLGYGENATGVIDLTDNSWAIDNLTRLDNAEITIENEKIKVPVTATKSWEGGPENNRPTVYFQLYRQAGENETEPVTDAEIKELVQGTTSVTWENQVAFDDAGNEYTFSVKEVDAEGNDFAPTGYTKVEDGLTVTNTISPIEISVTKVWNDSENQDGLRPDSVKVQLQADGVDYRKAVILGETNNWAHSFTGLQAYNDQDELIVYSVVELDSPEGYESNVTMNQDGNLVLTNTHIPAITELTVEKAWDDGDDQDGLRPESIEVQLMAGKESIGEPVELTVETGWTHTWLDLPVNEAGEPIEYSVVESTVPNGYKATTSEIVDGVVTITNAHTPAVVNIPVSKVWSDANDQDGVRPETITANLLADGDPVGDIELSADNEWAHTFENLPVYNNGEEIIYTVTENKVENYSTAITGTVAEGFVITNSYTPEETSVTVTKNWQDGNNQDGNRPESIEVQLTADGVATDHTAVLNEENNWTATWTGLALNSKGTAIDYSVEEITEEDGYEVVVDAADHGNIILTNTYEPAVTELTVNKVWDDADNQDGIRSESVEVQLIAGNQEYGDPVTLNAENNWSYTWTDLAVNAAGEAIEYSLVEVNVPEGYTSIASEIVDGTITVTNVHEPEVTSIKVSKVWDDADNQDGIRPENITVELKADGDVVAEPVELNEDNSWTHTWTDLAVNAAGEAIEYEIIESDVPEGYEVNINSENPKDIVITNTYTPVVTEVTVNKVWDDANNQDGLRPESVEVQLMADGETVGETIKLDDSNEWTNTWSNLPMNETGEPIEYSVVESNIPAGYEAITSEIVDGVVTITNTHTPAVVNIPVSKVWEDADNQDDVRPETITANLLADGDPIGNIELSADNEWTHTFENLPVYNNGSIINYTVTEDTVEGYSTMIEGTVAEGFVITNSYTPEETSVTVTKNWQDSNNQDGNRPESIEVQLTANGEAVGKSIELNAENNWTHTWSELALNEAGISINYSVVESNVPTAYEVAINDENHGNIIVTNTYTPAVTDLTVNKAWDDANNQDGIRSKDVTVQLIADNEKIGEPITLKAENEWTHTWTALPVNASGEAIEYSVIETNVPEGYEATVSEIVDGTITVTNTHEPEMTSIPVTKVWNDANNQDGIRPESIMVNLLKDGELFRSVEVTADDSDDWSYIFEDLPVYANGEKVVYTISEDEVTGYTVEYDGMNIINTHVPEVITVSGNKTWDDANNQDGIRPESITVNLLANGLPVDSVTVTAEEEWAYSFANLPKFENGEVILYTITENSVENYTSEINGHNITNSYTPGETSVTVTKAWDDNNDKAGFRPESIEVQLYADGEAIEEPVVLSEANEWTHIWTELAAKANGEDILYTVSEVTVVASYTATINDSDKGNIILTNTYTPAKVSVGDYVWFDENKDGLQDDTDIPVEGVVLTIVDEEGNPVTDVYGDPVKPTTTDENGFYIFENLPIDHVYTVRIDREASKEVLKGYMPTLHEVGDDNSVDSSTWEATSRHLTEDKEHDPTLDFGFVKIPKVSVGDYVWIDENRDGLQDETDTPIPGVVLEIVDENGNPVTDIYGNPVGPTTTDEKGHYIFENLPIDKTYTVKINREASKEALKNYVPTLEEEGDDKSKDSSTWEATSEYMDKDGKHDPTLDFGFVIPKVSVGDYVWIDVNKDGLQDETDIPLEGIVLTIVDEEGNPVTDVYGNPVGPTTTDENGFYIFENLPIDHSYTVRIDREASAKVLEGYVPTLQEVGLDISIDSSTWEATSRHLTKNGEHDPTLDFGFVVAPVDPVNPEEPGEPAEPEEPSEPTVPVDPEEPTDPAKPEEPKAPEKEAEEKPDKEESKDKELPYAGREASMISYIIGSILVLSGLGTLFVKNRKKQED